MTDTPEAAASLNIRFASKGGFEGLLTVRGFEEEGAGLALLAKLGAIEESLHKKGCKPIYGKNSGKAAPAGEKSKGWCPIHEVQMKRHEKDGSAWYSHQVDGEWCHGKEKK